MSLINEPELKELKNKVHNFEMQYKLKNHQKDTLYKMIEGLLLLRNLSNISQTEFIFRGGTCLPLILKTDFNRFSTDLDFISINHEQFVIDLNKMKNKGIIRDLEIGRSQFSWVLSRTAIINCIFYEKIGSIPIHSTINMTSDDITFDTQESAISINYKEFTMEFEENVMTPTLNSLLADKLLTLSVNTIGYPENHYTSRFKQVYDCGLLSSNVQNLKNLFFNFRKHFDFKLKTMNTSFTFTKLFNDFNQSLIPFIMLRMNPPNYHPLYQNFSELRARISNIAPHIFSYPYPKRQLFSIFGSKLLILIHIFKLLNSESISLEEGEKILLNLDKTLEQLTALDSSERNNKLRQIKNELRTKSKYISTQWSEYFPLRSFDVLGLETINLLEILFKLD